MSQLPDDRQLIDMTKEIWSEPDPDQMLVDADCSPSKTCKNMVGVSFDGFAESGSDLGQAWREKLEREGKRNEDGKSLRDLVLGNPGA